MKKDLHPNNYRSVVFQDLNDGSTIITRSTAPSDETITIKGTEYPLIKVHISSSSHPFYTGQEKLVDVEGRVDRFKARRDAADAKRKELASKAKKAQKKQAEAKEEVSHKVGGGSHQSKPKAAKKTATPKAATAEKKTEEKKATTKEDSAAEATEKA